MVLRLSVPHHGSPPPSLPPLLCPLQLPPQHPKHVAVELVAAVEAAITLVLYHSLRRKNTIEFISSEWA